MNNKSAIFVISGAAIGYYLYRKYTFSQKIVFEISDISIGGSLSNPIINLKIFAINPTNVETSISNIMGELKLNDNIKIADISYLNKTVIKPFSKTEIFLNIYPKITNIIESISQVLISKKGNLTITGNAQIDTFKVPINLNYIF